MGEKYMNVPFIDLYSQYQSIKKEIDDAIEEVIRGSHFIGGKTVANFESQFCQVLGIRNCVGVGNGTDALFIALKALGINKSDEVITAANTFIATAEAISATGAKVVFVDCHPHFYTIDADQIEAKITANTKAIIPVHLYGQPADMDAIMKISQQYKLYVVEDCAQAHLAKYNGKPIGTMGDLSCFSFYPGKNLGAFGDAGAIVSNNDLISSKCRMLANHGRIDKYNHEFEAYNTRLDGIQAAVLSVKLNHLEEWTKRRQEIALMYREYLKDVKQVILPRELKNADCVYHLFVVRVERRDDLQNFLNDRNIATGIHYPIGLPFLKAYDYLKFKYEDFPVTYEYQNKLLSLPLFPEMSDEMVATVSHAVKKFYS